VAITQDSPEIVGANGASAADAPLAVEVRDLEKSFRIPEHRIDTFKERAVHPFQRQDFRELRALRKVSFDVRKGEFFGIVGRNGSGKSTLLKILASIYRADAGSIRMAGRLAPFIELGVGFNQDLSARENVILNAVMMGLTPREARKRVDAVFEFAELNDFREQKLKNYSSGMSVRLAFSVMLQADADVLLIDEVLAVGDAAFQQKCTDVFHEMRDSDKTIIFVTHDMIAVQNFCHRAMLLHDGELLYTGEPEEVARRYYRLNFGGVDRERTEAGSTVPVPDVHARVVEARLMDADDNSISNVEQGEPIRFEAVVEARVELNEPTFSINCLNADEVHIFGIEQTLNVEGGRPDRLEAGQRVRIAGELENRLAPGRYFISLWVLRKSNRGDLAMQALSMVDFVVFGTRSVVGTIEIDGDLDAVPIDVEGEER